LTGINKKQGGNFMQELGKAAKEMTTGEKIARLCERINGRAQDLEKLAASKLSPLYIPRPNGGIELKNKDVINSVEI